MRPPRRIAAGCLAAVMAPVVTLGVITAQAAAALPDTPERTDVKRAPRAAHQVSGDVAGDPRALPALPEFPGTGPVATGAPGIVLDGSLGLSTSLTPTLAWKGGTESDITYEVARVDGTRLWSITGGASGVRVKPGVLHQGGVYEWSARRGGVEHGPFVFRVDVQREGAQVGTDFGGVTVATVTGEPSYGMSTRPLNTVSGPVKVMLAYRPSDAGALGAAPGVPAGWRLSTSADSPWMRLMRVSATRAVLFTADGAPVPLVQASAGAWRPSFGKGQSWPQGQRALVSQPVAADGTAGPFQVTDRSGVVTTFSNAAAGQTVRPSSIWSAKAPTLRSTYDTSGRLTKITDPVSGRSIDIAYGGASVCPASGAKGFKPAPQGMLCRIHGWDGGVTEVLYRAADGAGGPLAGPKIARIVGDAQAGNLLLSQEDLAYDGSGRLAAVRSPLANSALAAGVLEASGLTTATADSPALLTTIAYDPQGRVSGITRPAAVQAGVADIPARASRNYSYTSAGGFQETAPGRDRPLMVSQADPRTMLVSSSTDSAGRVTTSTWNAATQSPLSKVAPGGMTTKWAYDAQGRLLERIGPTTQPASGSAPQQSEQYDTLATGTSTRQALVGLQATVWGGTGFAGSPEAESVGPRIGGKVPASLAYSYTRAGGPFSARLEGAIIVPKGGISQIASTLPAQQLWIDGERCEAACPQSLDLAARPPGSYVDVRIDIRSSAAGTSAVGVAWTPKGGQPVAIPSSALRPMLPNPTATTARDQLRSSGTAAPVVTDVAYAASNTSQVTGGRSPSGATVSRGYEAWNPAAGLFGRATTSTPVNGVTFSTSYYPSGQAAAVPCPGVAANQGGLAKRLALPGGLSLLNAYDSAGRVIGQEQNGGIRTCVTYDLAGNLTGLTMTGAADGGGGQSVVAADPVLNGNPLATRVSFPGSGRAPETSTVDILGRQVSNTDTWGTTAAVSYSAFDEIVAETVRTAGGVQTTTNRSYNEDGSLHQVSRDGAVLSTSAYQDATGNLTGIEYGNGLTVGLGYDATGNASSRTVALDGATYTEIASASPAGRTLRRQITGPGTAASWSYGYDRDGHLTSAALSGTVPEGVRTGTWAYTANALGQRTRIDSPYTAAGGFTYAYAPSGAVTATSDPRFAAGFAYDANGRATKAGPLSLAYGPSGQATRVADAAGTSEQRAYLPSGGLIETSITTSAGATSTVRRSLGGLLLDASGAVSSQIISLPGAVSVQLPPPGGDGASATWRVGDLAGSLALQVTGASLPAAVQLYDPDGNRLSGPPASTDAAKPNFAFRGQQTAPLEVPVTHMGAREYVPALGTFLQSDPVPGSAPSAYGYANADPINASDPSGGFFLFDGDWWKNNWVGVAVGTAVAVVITVATAGTGAAVGASIGATIARGAAIGMLSSAAGDAATQGVEIAAGKRDTFDFAQLGVSAAVGAAAGAAGARIGSLTARGKAAIAAKAAAKGGGRVSTASSSVSYRTGSVAATNRASIIQRAYTTSPSQGGFGDFSNMKLDRVWMESQARSNPLGASLREKLYPRFGRDDGNFWRLDVDASVSW